MKSTSNIAALSGFFARKADAFLNAFVPSRAKRAKRASAARKALAAIVVSLTVAGNFTMIATAAQALTVDASAASFNFAYPTNGTLLSGASVTSSGAVVKFSNITGTPVAGISVDAIVTTTLSTSTITNYDNIGNASSNTDYFQVNTDVSASLGTAAFKFDFYEANSYTGPGTGTPIVLKNVSLTSIDLDGSGSYCQFSDFTGFQSYVLGASTSVQVKTNATDATVPVGTTRFLATSCQNNSNRIEDAVQVKYDSVTSFTAKFGTDRSSSPNYFGVAFKPMSAMFAGAAAAPVVNPSNQPPTSTDTTRYVTNSEPSIIQLADFGTYQDPDSNPFLKVKITTLPAAGALEKLVNGSWVAVALNDEILVSDISNGTLRFTGTTDRSLQFKVYDGITYSTNANTLSLLMSDQGQVITFNNPGTKTPTAPAFASGATSDSGLTVTLTSLTPGVCTVSGTNITPVAAGLCTIVATQAGNRTYSAAAPVSQTFPISTLTPQTITAANPGAKTWNGSQFTVTVSPTATSNLTVTMLSLSPSVCTVSGFVITIVGPGNCTIRNVQGGNGTYAPAPEVEYTFPVSLPSASYTLTYDGNSSTGGTVPASVTGTGSKTLATNSGSLVRSGYTFAGWNTAANGSGTHYDVSASYTLSADATLYAQWTLITYTLTYDDNSSTGGTVPGSVTGTGSKTLATNSGSLVRTGYTFAGWNTAADGSGTHYDVSDSYNLTADATLYAQWTEITYMLTYDGNASTGGSVPASVTGKGSKTLATNSGNLARAGYSFAGWNTASNGSGTHYDVGDSFNLTADVTLYAQWTTVIVDYTITYLGNSSTGGTVPADQTGNGSLHLAENTGALVRSGYILTGWNTAANGGGTHYTTGANYSLFADITLYAEWVRVYTITYDGNSSIGGVAPGSITGYEPVTIEGNSGNLVRANYNFKGWNTAADGTGTHYEAGDVLNLTSDVTLYAQWELIPQVTYNPNGATEGTVPGSVDQGSPVTIDPNTGQLKRSGFKFKGWNTKADGTGTTYVPGESPALPVGTVLYAQWEPVEEEVLATTGSELNAAMLFFGFISLIGGALVLMRASNRKD